MKKDHKFGPCYDDFTLICTADSVCETGLPYFSLLIFPMCKAVTESHVTVGESSRLLRMTNSHLKVKLEFAEMSVEVYLWEWDLALLLQCSHTHINIYWSTKEIIPSFIQGALLVM